MKNFVLINFDHIIITDLQKAPRYRINFNHSPITGRTCADYTLDNVRTPQRKKRVGDADGKLA